MFFLSDILSQSNLLTITQLFTRLLSDSLGEESKSPMAEIGGLYKFLL